MKNYKNIHMQLNILLLEDSSLDSELIQEFLESNYPQEIQLKITENRANYISALSSNKYDLILADFNLPGFNGFEALELAKAANPLTPFIIVSGSVGEETAADLINLGATDYVSKDKLERLIHSIDRALKESKEILENIKAKKDLEQSYKLMSYTIEHDKNLIAVFDRNFKFVYVSQSYIEGFGIDNNIIGMHLDDVFPNFPNKWKNIYRKVLSGESISSELDSYLQKDGGKEWVSWECLPWYEYNGSIGGIISYMEFITKRIEMEESLKKNDEKTTLILNSTSEGIFGVDKNGICTFANKSIIEMLGYDNPSEFIGKNMHKLIHYKHGDGTKYQKHDCIVSNSIRKGKQLRGDDEKIWRKDGSKIAVECTSNPQIENDKIVGAVVSIKDITERLKYQESLIQASFNDGLTNISNRRYYDKEIVKLHSLENYPLTIVVGDIDGLKFINDSFGHYAGDEYLIRVANILKKSCRDKDLIARMGGDEFVLVLPKTSEVEAEKLIDLINKQVQNEEINSLPLSVSFGYSTVKDNKKDILEIFKEAEDAMYQEKLLVKTSMRSSAIETMLNTLNEKDSYSEKHSREVSLIGERLAKSYGMNRLEIKEVSTAGLLHDIGKIIISSDILNKEGKLTSQEFEEMKEHPEIGFRILNTSRNMGEISRIVLSHHERWDGKGYPRGIKNIEIPIQSRIISIADAFEAMTSERRYRKPVSNLEALKEIKDNAGTQFDPELVNIFERDFNSIVNIK